MSSTSPPLSLVRKILHNQYGVAKTAKELELIHFFITSETETIYDELWTTLSRSQKLQLCSYFRYKQVESDSLIQLKDPFKNQLDVELLILIKGSGNLACGDYSLQLDSCSYHRYPCLGTLPIPQTLRKLMSQVVQDGQQQSKLSTYQEFIRKIHKRSQTTLDDTRPSILINKGSHYIYLNYLDCQIFMKKLFEDQISQRILHHFNFHNRRKRRLHFLTIPAGHPIITQGKEYDKIVLTIRGTCRLDLKEACERTKDCIQENETTMRSKLNPASNNLHCVSQAGPLSFLGFLPFFVDDLKEQPITVTAMTNVRVLILEADEFIKNINRNFREAFQILSSRQLRYLKTKVLGKGFVRQEENLASIGKYVDDNVIYFPSSSIDAIENIVTTRIKKNPRFSKHKLLREFTRLVQGDQNTDEIEEYEDLFLRFDFKDECIQEIKNFLQENKGMNDVDEGFDLKPFPSILLSHKPHGKTLPVVDQSHGYLNPYNLKISKE